MQFSIRESTCLALEHCLHYSKNENDQIRMRIVVFMLISSRRAKPREPWALDHMASQHDCEIWVPPAHLPPSHTCTSLLEGLGHQWQLQSLRTGVPVLLLVTYTCFFLPQSRPCFSINHFVKEKIDIKVNQRVFLISALSSDNLCYSCLQGFLHLWALVGVWVGKCWHFCSWQKFLPRNV